MTLSVPEETITYSPVFGRFARKISDEDSSRIDSDPVARSIVLRQAADLVGPDWLVVDGTDQLLALLPERNGQPVGSYEFDEPVDEEMDDLVEVISILANLRSEPLVVSLPDPVSLVRFVFGDDWMALLQEDEFAALDTLHLASQVLTDVLREFDGNVDGLILDAVHLSDAMDVGLGVDDYLLELGAVFNLTDHHNVTALSRMPVSVLGESVQLSDEFDVVLFDSLPESKLSVLPEPAASVGCSFPSTLWNSGNTDDFRSQAKNYLDTASDGFVLAPEIPATVNPDYVQILGEVIAGRR
jgi:hypothetical protein